MYSSGHLGVGRLGHETDDADLQPARAATGIYIHIFICMNK